MAGDVCQKPVSRTSELSQIAREILDLFARAHRKPGARMLVSEVEARIRAARTPLISSITELINANYMIAPDKDTVELTDRGFDATQRANYSRLDPAASAPKKPNVTARQAHPKTAGPPTRKARIFSSQ
jgi:hypothetical protein